MMKYYLLTIFVFLLSCTMSSQLLTQELNSMRVGDVLKAKEIPFLSPGKQGANVSWDFSNMNLCPYNTSKEYVRLDTDSVLHYVTSHGERFFRQQADTLFCTGYSGDNIEVSHLLPDRERVYPFCYGDSIESFFYGEGYYSQKLHFVGYGQTKRKIESFGRLILPDVDTLKNVLLLHESARLGQKLSSLGEIKSNGDSLCYLPDSLLGRLESDNVTWHLDTWSWYVAGYRYPVIKSIRNSIVQKSNERVHFERSFYYPPEEWELSETDEANEEERRRMADTEWYLTKDGNDTINYTYTMRGGFLEVSLVLDETSEVELIATTHQGFLLARTPKETVQPGTVLRTLDLRNTEPGVFIFTLIVNDKLSSQKITKQ